MRKEADDAQTEVARRCSAEVDSKKPWRAQDIRSPSWDLNLEPTAYKEGVPTSQP
jgi:hypothetical protein